MTAQAERLTKLIELCESFLTEFRDHAKAASVKLDEAQASLDRSGMRPSTSEKDRATARKLAEELLASKADDDVKVQSHLLLIKMETYTQKPDLDKVASHAEALLKDFPQNKAAPFGQYLYGQLLERTGDKDRAIAAYRVLADKYPESQPGKQAQGIIRRLELLGKELKDFSFTDVNGQKVDIADYKGKVVLIDFWATWCGPCRGELPNVKQTLDKYGSQGFAIIGVSLDYPDKQKLLDFLKKENMTWPQYFDGKGWGCEMSQRYGINSIPATFLVDRKGVVRYMGVRGEALGQRVGELIGEK